MKQGVCVGAFIQNKNGEFLIVKRSDVDEFMAGMWELPGGGIEVGENSQEGLKREVFEETGLHVIVGKPLGVHDYMYNGGNESVHRVEITFLCSFKESDIVHLSFEHSDYKWISPSEIKNWNFSGYIMQVITDSINNL